MGCVLPIPLSTVANSRRGSNQGTSILKSSKVSVLLLPSPCHTSPSWPLFLRSETMKEGVDPIGPQVFDHGSIVYASQ